MKYRQAITLDPKCALAYANLGNALNGKQNYDGAIAKCQKAVVLDPKNDVFRNDLDRAGQAKEPAN